VVKANAYGHGAGQIALALENAGADVLACVTELVLWLGALFCLAAAILVGIIEAIARRTARPALLPIPTRFALPRVERALVEDARCRP